MLVIGLGKCEGYLPKLHGHVTGTASFLPSVPVCCPHLTSTLTFALLHSSNPGPSTRKLLPREGALAGKARESLRRPGLGEETAAAGCGVAALGEETEQQDH